MGLSRWMIADACGHDKVRKTLSAVASDGQGQGLMAPWED
jgi:hypothetical protein